MTTTDRATPLPYQNEGIQLIEQFGGRVLLADEMGLGKTLQALWSVVRNKDWWPILVVCPASVKFNWQFEAKHHVDLLSSVCEGEKPPVHNGRDFSTMSPLTIINYDILRFWTKYLKKLNFKTIIFDEAQYLGSRKTKRTKAAQSISRDIPHVMALSGTPLTNRPAELWPTLNILWPEKYPSFWSYAQKHCNPRLIYGRWDYRGSSRLGELHTDLKESGMIRRRTEDVLKDLPELVRRIIPCEMDDPDEYQEATTDFMSWLKKNAGHKVRSAGRAEALTKLGYLLRIVAKQKLRSVVRWANAFLEETDEKLILFAVHHKVIDVLQRRCRTQSVTVDGSVTGRDRFAAVEQFQKDKKTRLFIGNIQAAGVGITLTAARTVGFAEIWWKPAAHTQAEKRPHRIGQKDVVFANYLIVPDTIEESLCKLLQAKQKVISAVLDGGISPNDLNLYDELIRKLHKGGKL